MNILLETGITGNMDGNCQNDDCVSFKIWIYESDLVFWWFVTRKLIYLTANISYSI